MVANVLGIEMQNNNFQKLVLARASWGIALDRFYLLHDLMRLKIPLKKQGCCDTYQGVLHRQIPT